METRSVQDALISLRVEMVRLANAAVADAIKNRDAKLRERAKGRSDAYAAAVAEIDRRLDAIADEHSKNGEPVNLGGDNTDFGDQPEQEPEDHSDDICWCGDPECSRPFGHVIEE